MRLSEEAIIVTGITTGIVRSILANAHATEGVRIIMKATSREVLSNVIGM